MNNALQSLEHIVVLMMENRSFDHMLGGLRAVDPRIDGLTGKESNPDATGQPFFVQPKAEFQSQLDPDPGHHFPDVNTQLFNGQDPSQGPNMQGFISAYFQKQRDLEHSRKIMYYFTPDQLPVLTTLARKYAVFNRWFSSLPGPTLPNRAFAHFGTSFGKVDMSVFYLGEPYPSIYERMNAAGKTAKIYYTDQTIAMAFLLKSQPQMFGTFDQFLKDCESGNLPEYSFIEPRYADTDENDGAAIACDQHPDHNVQSGEYFIADVYNAIRKNNDLWTKTALLIVYDEHGGIYDHVPPPACMKDGFKDTSTGFQFDRLGVRVPAVLVSPWVKEGTVISPLDANGNITDEQVYEHASIPATVTEFFLGTYDKRSPREKAARSFLDVLALEQPRQDDFLFKSGRAIPVAPVAASSPAMTSHANAVSIPAPSITASDPSRPMSGLLWEQVQHLRAMEAQLPPSEQTGTDVHSLQTEGEASRYMNAVMARLKSAAAMPAGAL